LEHFFPKVFSPPEAIAFLFPLEHVGILF
jgi:hypothetical protein